MTNIIITGLEIDDWFKQLPTKIDVMVTDPPYPFNSQNGTGRYKNMYQKFTWQTLDDIFLKTYDIMNDSGRLYVFANRDGLFRTLESLKNAKFKFLNLLIWNKMHFGGGYHYRKQEEYIVYVSKGDPKCYVKGISNIFEYKRPTKKDINLSIGYNPIAVSAKPYQIWRDILVHGANQDEVIADPFAGTNPMRAAVLLETQLNNKFKDVYTNVYLT